MRGLGIAQIPPPPAVPPEEKLDYIANQLYRLVKIGEQLIGQVPIVIEPKLMPAYPSITIEPQSINDFIQVVAPPGKTQIREFAVAISCLAGVTTLWGFRIPAGWVSVIRTPLIFSSDFYSEDLTMEGWLDESRIPVTLGPLPMTSPRTLHMNFVVKRYGMDFEFVNNSATDALISIEATGFWLEKSYYEEFYLPLVKKIYQAAEALVK